jgi:hypothetical protein
MDFMERIAAYESGELAEHELVALFQELIDSGMLWSLQAHYREEAAALIQAGYCIDNRCAIDLTETELDGVA